MIKSSPERIAMLHYEANGFHVLAPGTHVKCAVTAEAIPLEVLRYWCVERQEAYANCGVATQRLLGQV